MLTYLIENCFLVILFMVVKSLQTFVHIIIAQLPCQVQSFCNKVFDDTLHESKINFPWHLDFDGKFVMDPWMWLWHQAMRIQTAVSWKLILLRALSILLSIYAADLFSHSWFWSLLTLIWAIAKSKRESLNKYQFCAKMLIKPCHDIIPCIEYAFGLVQKRPNSIANVQEIHRSRLHWATKLLSVF